MPELPKDAGDNKPLVVRRGRVESVDLYEIKDSELDLLEKGSPADLQLVFAIFLLTLAFSGFCTLATATFIDNTIKTIFIVVTVIGIVLGIYFLIAWGTNRTSLKKIADQIRHRIPPDVAQDADIKIENQPAQGETDNPSG